MTFDALDRLISGIASAVPPGVSLACTPLGASDARLYAVEAAALARAVEKRRDEFLAGRAAARRAMQTLGHGPRPIPMGEDRSPIWPDGLTGSISHTGFGAVSAVAHQVDVQAIGIDVEPDEPIEDSLIRAICLPEELSLDDPDPGRMARRIFSAKEAAYKAQYPRSRTIFGFDGLTLGLQSPNTYLASFTRDVLPYRAGQGLLVQQWVEDGIVLSLCVIAGSRAPSQWA